LFGGRTRRILRVVEAPHALHFKVFVELLHPGDYTFNGFGG
jgi:hypothetical protein